MAFNWLKRKFQLSNIKAVTEDVARFLSILKGSDDREIAMVVAMATIMRIKLRALGRLKDSIFDIGGNLAEQASAQFFLSQILKECQNNRQFSESSGLMVWLHTLRSFTYPEIRSLGREMWQELLRGFPLVTQTLNTIENELGGKFPSEAYDEYKFIPLGLEPKKVVNKENSSSTDASEKKLYFKTPEAALEYSCAYMDCNHVPGHAYPAIVRFAPPKENNSPESYAIELACNGSSSPAIALKDPRKKNLNIAPGDFVMVGIGKNDLLFIAWKIKPVFDLKSSEWEKFE